MDKNGSLFADLQEGKAISFSKRLGGKKIKVDFDAPDLSSNGGLLFANAGNCSFLDKISDCIPDVRNPYFIQHTIGEMVRQRVGPRTVIEVRGDSHFCSHEFMDWIKDAGRCHVCFTTGLTGNSTLLKKIKKQKRRAENDFKKNGQGCTPLLRFLLQS